MASTEGNRRESAATAARDEGGGSEGRTLSYEELLGMYEESIQDIQEGQIVTGHILRVDENVVVLDVGFKSEGAVPLDEFKPTDSLEVGSEVDVFLENLEDQEGRVVLSKKKADFFKVWDKIRIAYDNGTIVQGRLARKIKGGVIVDLFGVDAFLPGSQIALRRVPDIDALVQALRQNAYWLNALQSSQILGRDPTNIPRRSERTDALTVENVHEAMRKYLPADRYTVVTLMPEATATRTQ